MALGATGTVKPTTKYAVEFASRLKMVEQENVTMQIIKKETLVMIVEV